MDALETTPERFVEPLCWEEENSERYLKCLQYHDFYSIDRNGERYNCAVLILDRLHAEWAKKAAALIPTERLSRALSEFIHAKGRQTHFHDGEALTKLQEQLGIPLTLERDAVLPGTCWYALLHILDYVTVGPPAKDHLSVLVPLFLHAMLLEKPLRGELLVLIGAMELGEKPGLDPMYEITHSEKAIRLLREENRELVQQALDEIKREHPESSDEVTALERALRWRYSFCSRFKNVL